MSKYYLMNSVHVGTVSLIAGTLIDDAQDSVANIKAAGGLLISNTTPGIAAVIAIIQGLRAQGKLSEADATAIMGAFIEGKAVTLQDVISMPAPATAGTAMHAQVAAGAPVNIASAFTIPYPRRSVQIVVGAGGVATNYTVTGTDPSGNVISEVIAASGAGTFQGVLAYETLTSVTTPADPQGTTDVQTGLCLGLGVPFTGTPLLGVTGVTEAALILDGPSGTIKPTSAPNSARNYLIRYTPVSQA